MKTSFWNPYAFECGRCPVCGNWKKNTFQPVVDLSHHSLLKCGLGLGFFGTVLRIPLRSPSSDDTRGEWQSNRNDSAFVSISCGFRSMTEILIFFSAITQYFCQWLLTVVFLAKGCSCVLMGRLIKDWWIEACTWQQKAAIASIDCKSSILIFNCTLDEARASSVKLVRTADRPQAGRTLNPPCFLVPASHSIIIIIIVIAVEFVEGCDQGGW